MKFLVKNEKNNSKIILTIEDQKVAEDKKINQKGNNKIET